MYTSSNAWRLIVAADTEEPLPLAQTLKDTGVVFKENVGLRNRGYALGIDSIHRLGMGYCGDLKLIDIQETLRRDGKALRRMKPEMITVMCSAPMKALQAIREELPETEILGVTVLTDFEEGECRDMYNGRSIEDQVKYFAQRALDVKFDGVVCAGKEIEAVRSVAGNILSINITNVRSHKDAVRNDNQNPARTFTPKEAIRKGADRIMVGRQIIQAPDPRAEVVRILGEMSRTYHQIT